MPANTKPKVKPAPQPGSVTKDDIMKIYLYRHLLRNLDRNLKALKAEEMKEAPSVKGPRAAAVLARLWANDDLGLPPAPQKVIAHDLGIGETVVGAMLKRFRTRRMNNPPCVELISDGFAREKWYKITEAGKQELSRWMFAHYTHSSFMELIKTIPPNATNVFRTLMALKKEVETQIGASGNSV